VRRVIKRKVTKETQNSQAAMPRSSILFSVLLLLFTYCKGDCDTASFKAGDRTFARCATLLPQYDIYWNVNGDNVIIALNLRGNKGGWLGFGVSVNGGMKGADIATFSYSAGEYVLEDRYATEYAEPAVDDLQNLELLDFILDDTQTTVVYSRAIKSCDVDQDVPILSGGTQVIFAFGSTSRPSYHGTSNRGTKTLYFFREPTVPQMPDDAQVVEILSPLYEIPSKDTTYTCSSHVLPSDKKYHVIQWRPLVNSSLIHHLVLYGCPYDVNTPDPYECGMAPYTCTVLQLAWSVGQSGDDWLDQFALPIGAGFLEYVVLQVHYNNPDMVSGVHDQSGFALTYTSQLRPFDLGTFALSYNIGLMAIPPYQEAYPFLMECAAECTEKHIPKDGINMVYWFPHMHQIGHQIWVELIRDGKELLEIHRDDHYDFNKQQTYPVNVTLFPGDRLRMHCTFDSTARTSVTVGGESSREEMCVGIVQYYPLIPNFTRCHRSISPNLTYNAICDPDSNTFVSVANYTYTPLPPPESTCDAEVNTTSGSPSSAKYSMLLVVFIFVFL